MKASCVVLTTLIICALLAVGVMVKYATDITVEERRREYSFSSENFYPLKKTLGIITLSENVGMNIAERYPFVAAIISNSTSSWRFTCFASIIHLKWLVTSAHCRGPGLHKVLVLNDYTKNHTHTYPIMFWKEHPEYNRSGTPPVNDIALARIKIPPTTIGLMSAVFDENEVTKCEATVWKTVSTMDMRLYLTNDFERIIPRIIDLYECTEFYDVILDDSSICIDMTGYTDCFVNEFGPIYSTGKVIGVLAVKPKNCDHKLAVFTNVSFYAAWIGEVVSTHTADTCTVSEPSRRGWDPVT